MVQKIKSFFQRLKRKIRKADYRETQVQVMLDEVYEVSLLDLADKAMESLSERATDSATALQKVLDQIDALQLDAKTKKALVEILEAKFDVVQEFVKEKVGK